FQDKRVRQALTYALDRPTIVRTLLGAEAAVTPTPMTPASWAYNSNVRPYPFDPETARKLLAEAGWTPGADGILQKDGQPFRFTLSWGKDPKMDPAAVFVQQYLKKMGMDVT